MAQNDRFLIAPYDEGLRQDVKPWLIPDTAFESLRNAYVFRGRVRKRFGSELSGQGAVGAIQQDLFSKLAIPLVATAIKIGTTDVAGAFALAGAVLGTDYVLGTDFRIGAGATAYWISNSPVEQSNVAVVIPALVESIF